MRSGGGGWGGGGNVMTSRTGTTPQTWFSGFRRKTHQRIYWNIFLRFITYNQYHQEQTHNAGFHPKSWRKKRTTCRRRIREKKGVNVCYGIIWRAEGLSQDIVVLLPVWVTDFYLFRTVQTGSGSHTSSYSWGTAGSFFAGIKRHVR
jgi:hypothetical protein